MSSQGQLWVFCWVLLSPCFVQPDELNLTIWVVRVLVGLFALLMLFDVVDDVLLRNRYAGIPTELSGLIAAIVAGLMGHNWFRRNGKKPKE